MKKIAVFVDVQNVYYTVKDTFNCHFNYRALWRQLSDYGEICIANAYAIDKNDSQQQAFQNILKTIGFDVKLKPYIQRSDGSAKGDWDVGIVIDIIKHAPELDRIVLLSGDGDFDLLLKKIKSKYNTDTEVYGVESLTANSLIKEAKLFNPISGDLLLR